MEISSKRWVWAKNHSPEGAWVECASCGFIMRRIPGYEGFCPFCWFDGGSSETRRGGLTLQELYKLTE